MKKFIALLLILTITIPLSGCLYWDYGNAATAIFTFELIEEGEASFEILSVEKNITEFHVKTARTTVGAALLELELIEGEEDEELGFIVKVVDGLAVSDGANAKWKFYINDEESEHDIKSTSIITDTLYKLLLD
jgi:hypothetical protein